VSRQVVDFAYISNWLAKIGSGPVPLSHDHRPNVTELVGLMISRCEVEAGGLDWVLSRLKVCRTIREDTWRYRGQMTLVVRAAFNGEDCNASSACLWPSHEGFAPQSGYKVICCDGSSTASNAVRSETTSAEAGRPDSSSKAPRTVRRKPATSNSLAPMALSWRWRLTSTTVPSEASTTYSPRTLGVLWVAALATR